MDVIIVCHTEFGTVSNRKTVFTKDPIGVVSGVENLAEVSSKYGAKVTYAVCPEVASYFPNNVEGEIALHIHPGWEKFSVDGVSFYVGDMLLRQKCPQLSTSSVLRDYSLSEQSLLVKEGIRNIETTLGKTPQVFVAGRWSVNNDTVKALVANGILRDCSASAHSKMAHYDWSRLPRICLPYHPSDNDYQRSGNSPLLVVPISQMVKGGNVNPEMARVCGLLWLQLCFKEFWIRKVPLFHICLHSPSMVDKYFVSVMDKLLGFIAKHDGVKFKFVSGISEYGN